MHHAPEDRADAPPHSRWKRFFVLTARAGGVLAIFRVGIFWYLLWREWAGTQSLDTLPLILLLYPEGAVVPSGTRATIASDIAITAGLVLGSMLLVTPFTAPLSFPERHQADSNDRK
jgi:hypothetical protein